MSSSPTLINLETILLGSNMHLYYTDSDYLSKIKRLYSPIATKIIEKTMYYKNTSCNLFKKHPLENIICNMFNNFSPAPFSKSELAVDKKLIVKSTKLAEGVNGSVHISLCGLGIIKKSKRPIDHIFPEILLETFINFVCINDFIIQTKNRLNMPCTYGYFLCNNDLQSTANLCSRSGSPSIFLIQEKIEGIPLRDYLESTFATNSDCLIIFRKILRVLSKLHAFSNYKLIHGDLHGENIMVYKTSNSKLRVSIIDWGMGSVTVNERRYYNFIEKELVDYLKNYSKTVNSAFLNFDLISGLYDVNLLILEFINYGKIYGNTEIIDTFISIRKRIYPKSLRYVDKISYLWRDITQQQLIIDTSSSGIKKLITELNSLDYATIKKMIFPK